MSGDANLCPGCQRPTSARKRTTLCLHCATGGKLGKRGRPRKEAGLRESVSLSVNEATAAAFAGATTTAARILMDIVAANDGRAPNDDELGRIVAALSQAE